MRSEPDKRQIAMVCEADSEDLSGPASVWKQEVPQGITYTDCLWKHGRKYPMAVPSFGTGNGHNGVRIRVHVQVLPHEHRRAEEILPAYCCPGLLATGRRFAGDTRSL